MKELNRFREFLSEGKMDKFKVGQTVKYKADGKEKEGEIEKIDGIYLKLKSGGSIPYQSVLDEISLRGLMGRDMKGEDLAADPKKLEKTLSKVMKLIGDPSVTDQVRDWLKMDVQEFPDTDYANPENLKLTAKAAAYYVGQEDEPNVDVPPLEENDKVLDEVINEGAFGDKAKAALENRLTGKAKAMVEDGDLFAEGGNVTYDEKDLKDGATPEQIEAIDQIKAAVIEMGGRVSYGDIDKDGILTYMYIVVDEAPTYDAVLKVITKESEGDNLFHDVFKSSK